MVRKAILLLSFIAVSTALAAQTTSTEQLGASCALENYVYHCDSAAFAKIFSPAKNVIVETQTVDAFARQQLRNMLTKKYGKQVVERDGVPELVFLIIPVGVDGINMSPGDTTLGSLRVYTATPEGGRGHLVWAETYSASQNPPWPAVVYSLISQFQKHFPVK